MKKRYGMAIILLFFLSAAIVTGCRSASDKTNETKNAQGNESKDNQPVTLENADRELTFKKPPERAVALYQQDAELMVALGLENKLVGYSTVIENTPAKYQKKLKDIPVLAKKGYPSKEVLLEADPDLLIGSVRSFSDDGVGTVEEYEDLGIISYVTKYEEPETIDNQVYKEIIEISRIFGVEDRGKKLIQSMQKEMDDIKDQVGEVKKPLKVFLISGGQSGSAQTTGGTSLDNELIERAGGENIFSDVDKYIFDVSWEEVIDRDPDVIVTSYCCGTDPDDLKKMISNNPTLDDVTAVKNKNYVAAQVEDTTGTVRIPKGLKTLAKGFYPDRFK